MTCAQFRAAFDAGTQAAFVAMTRAEKASLLRAHFRHERYCHQCRAFALVRETQALLRVGANSDALRAMQDPEFREVVSGE